MDASKAESTPVLVVGGGLVGLSAAVFLAWQGVPTVLVERHAGSSPHPRAIGFTARTLELYRAVGLGTRIPQVPPGHTLRRVRVESLAGAWFEETPWTPAAEGGPEAATTVASSPCSGAAIAQDRLEPILRDRAIELGADVRFETELIHLEPSSAGAVATLRQRHGGEYLLQANHVVAADGHRSPIRQALGIGRSGRGPIRTVRSVLFQAPLDEYLRAGISQFTIDQPGFQAFLTTYGDGRWVLIFSDDEERDEATLRSLVDRAIGRADLEIEIVVTGRWEMSALIADRFSSGSVFLAGDAAHTLPPNRGGYGANTGIEDAHNLAWKLAAVLSGESNPPLLATYDTERRPIAWLRHDQIFARTDYSAAAAGSARNVPILDDQAMEFGQLYRSAAVLGAGDELPPARRPEQWAGQPGTRAPHVWVIKDGKRLSTLDLFHHRWLLLAAHESWLPAASHAAATLGIDLESLRLDLDLHPADPASAPGTLQAAFGLGPTGAALVRPDGYVAWRAIDRPADPTPTLTDALRRVSSAAKPCPMPATPLVGDASASLPPYAEASS